MARERGVALENAASMERLAVAPATGKHSVWRLAATHERETGLPEIGMITEQRTITNTSNRMRPIAIAAECYRRWMGVELLDDIDDYLVTGVVVSRPDVFFLAKATEIDGQLTWFIRIFVGALDRLVPALPYRLPWIAFCRRNDGRIRRYSIERILHLVDLQLTNKLKRG